MLSPLELPCPTEVYDSSEDEVAGQKITVPRDSITIHPRTNKSTLSLDHLRHELPARNFTSIILFRMSPPASRVEILSGPIGGASLRHCLLSEVANCRADIATT